MKAALQKQDQAAEKLKKVKDKDAAKINQIIEIINEKDKRQERVELE